MNRLVTHLSKPLLLLATMLLPVQQSLDAVCDCQGGPGGVKQTVVGSTRNRCFQSETSCCSNASGFRQSCCDRSSLHGCSLGLISNPCQCPGGCHEKAAPGAIDPEMIGLPLVIFQEVVALQSISTIACAIATGDPLASAVVTNPANGSERCVWLCRYRL